MQHRLKTHYGIHVYNPLSPYIAATPFQPASEPVYRSNRCAHTKAHLHVFNLEA